MQSSHLFSPKPLSLRAAKEVFLPRLTEKEIHEMETGNLWMCYRITFVVSVLEAYLFFIGLLYYRHELQAQFVGLLSVAVCLCVCLVSMLVIRVWQRKKWVSSKRVQVLTEMLYWVLSIWGMTASYRHYVAGEQMLVFDTVQICFALMIRWHPIRAVIHIVGAYGAFYAMLWHFDGAAQVNGLNYFALGALLLSGYLLLFRKELLCVRLQAAQRDQILDLETASNHDVLTGLKNRRALRQDFPDYVGGQVWAIMADIDRFKQYNDTYGHAVGDRCLSAIGESIRSVFGIRSAYRYGGDEFLLFVEEADEAEVRRLLQQWEEAVSQIIVETAVERFTPHCSYGLADGSVHSEEELRELMRQADQKLYQVKGHQLR